MDWEDLPDATTDDLEGDGVEIIILNPDGLPMRVPLSVLRAWLADENDEDQNQ